MLLQSTHTAFNLETIGYENPLHGTTYEDRNLLLNCLYIVDKCQRWQTIAPLLHTWEIQYLANWLMDIVADREVPDRLSFEEPCISIALSEVSPEKDRFCFRLTFLYEAVPPWWDQPLHTPYSLSIDCKRTVLQHAVEQLAEQFATYGIRR